MAECSECEDLDTCPLGEACPVAKEAEAMQPWGCPWCGAKADIAGNNAPDYMRAIRAYDEWLEEHVLDCEPYIKEQGNNN